MGFPGGLSACNAGDPVQSLGWEDPWRKKWQLTPRLLAGKFHGWRSLAMAPHSITLAWKIPWMEEPGRPQSMGSLRVGHDWATSLSLFTFMHWRRKWQPTPVFLLGEPQRTEEPSGLPSMGSHRVGHDWSDLAAGTGDWFFRGYWPVSALAHWQGNCTHT